MHHGIPVTQVAGSMRAATRAAAQPARALSSLHGSACALALGTLLVLLSGPAAAAEAEPSPALQAVIATLSPVQQALLADTEALRQFRLTPEKLYRQLEGRDAAGVQAFLDALIGTLQQRAYDAAADAGQPNLVNGIEEPLADTADAAAIPLNPDAERFSGATVLRPPILDARTREPGPIWLQRYVYQSDGIPTFAGAPVAIRADDLLAGGVEVAFVGIPQSFSAGWRDAQNAPRILRGMYGLGGFDIYAGIDPALELSIADYGNIWVDYMSVELSVNHVREQVGQIVAAGAVPFIVGGDHSVMFPTVAAMADQHGADAIGVVHLDAHYGGARDLAHWYSDHQSVARLLAEDLLQGDQLIQLGLRGPEHDTAALQWLRSEGVQYHSMAEVEAEGWERVSASVLREAARGPDKLFISFDMSVLDPAYAAAAGRPVSNGLTPREVLPLLRRLCAEHEIIGFELLDVAPYLDLSYRSALLANNILHTCLTGMALRKRGLTQPHYLSPLASSHD